MATDYTRQYLEEDPPSLRQSNLQEPPSLAKRYATSSGGNNANGSRSGARDVVKQHSVGGIEKTNDYYFPSLGNQMDTTTSSSGSREIRTNPYHPSGGGGGGGGGTTPPTTRTSTPPQLATFGSSAATTPSPPPPPPPPPLPKEQQQQQQGKHQYQPQDEFQQEQNEGMLPPYPIQQAPPPPPPPLPPPSYYNHLRQKQGQPHQQQQKGEYPVVSTPIANTATAVATPVTTTPIATPTVTPTTASTPIASGGKAAVVGGTPDFEPEKKREDEDENVLDGEEALLDLGQLEELHQEAERMKALGNKHMASQEYTRAYNAYSAALQLSPVGPSSHVFLSNRAAALLSLKRYAAAATDARRAVALAPSFGKAHARLGQALYFLKDYTSAVAAYEDAIKFEPGNQVTQTYLEKAKAKLTKQQEKVHKSTKGEENSVAEESTQFTAINSIATDPNASAAVVQTKGFAQSGNGALTNAVLGSQLAQRQLVPQQSQTQQQQHFPQQQHGLSTTPVPTGSSPQTLSREQHLQQYNVSMSSDADPDFDEAVRIQRRAHKFLGTKQYKKAIEEYTAALFLIPDDPNLSPQLHLGRAHALNGSRRHASARNDAQLAIKIQPSPEAYSTLAKSLFYLKDYQGAIQAFDDCSRMLPPGESLSMFDQAYRSKAEAAVEEGAFGSSASYKSQVPKLPPPRFVPREEAINSTPNLPPMPKQWPQQLPSSPSALRCGPEREVVFFSESLGIKLNRGSDGIVRVLSVSRELPGSPVARKGQLQVGDVVREAAGVDIRRPITNIMWGDTVALIKMAPRPIALIVAQELSEIPYAVLEQRKLAEMEEQELASASKALISNLHLTDSPSAVAATAEEEKTEIVAAPIFEHQSNNIHFFPSPASDESKVVVKTNVGPEMTATPSPARQQEVSPSNIDAATNNNNALQNEKVSCLESEKQDEDSQADQGQDEGDSKAAAGTDPKTILCADIKGDVAGEPVVTESGKAVDKAPVSDDILSDGDKMSQADVVMTEENDSSAAVKKNEDQTQEGSTQDDAGNVEDQQNEVKGKSEIVKDENDCGDIMGKEEFSTLREKEMEIVGEVLFQRKATMATAYNGWDNLRWMSYAGVRKVGLCRTVSRLVGEKKKKGRLFGLIGGGPSEQYERRQLVLYDEPSLILILREPESVEELQELLDLPEGVSMEDNESALSSFSVVESVVDPITCKLKLSSLTTITSIVGDDDKSPEELSARRRSCFELITPCETILLSAVSLREEEEKKIVSDNDVSFYFHSASILETKSVEDAITQLLRNSHRIHYASEREENVKDDKLKDCSWQHQIILGTLHSHVVSGNAQMLQKAILQALETSTHANETNAGAASEGGKSYLDPGIIDATDDSGLTPLHYACRRRSSVMVAYLVNAGARVQTEEKTEHKSNSEKGKDNTKMTTPLHMCAANLDDKSLSTVLSVSYPVRPDPNTPDELDRTPMYVACTEGVSVGGKKDPEALGRCLSALDAWGGIILLAYSKLQHPISILASQFKVDELQLLLNYTKYRYPISCDTYGNSPDTNCMSISAMYHYPMHMAMIALFKETRNIVLRCSDCRNEDVNGSVDLLVDENSAYEMAPESKVNRTLLILLGHGFEPNERIDCLKGVFDGASELDLFIGFSPIQILACVALEAEKLKTCVEERAYIWIREVIGDVANVLVRNGARLSLDAPPTERQRNLMLPKKSSSLSSSLRNDKDSNHEENVGVENKDNIIIERSILKIDSNKPLMELLGGADMLNQAKSTWAEFKPVEGTYKLVSVILDAIQNSDGNNSVASFQEFNSAPGGNNEKSCSICWRNFGALVNRKQKCHVSMRYVCDECSSKRVIVVMRDSGKRKEFRLADGQYILAALDASKLVDSSTPVSTVPKRGTAPMTDMSEISKISFSESTDDRSERRLSELRGGRKNSDISKISFSEGTDDPSERRLSEIRRSRKLAEQENKNRDSLFGKAAGYMSDSSKLFGKVVSDSTKQIGGQIEGLTNSLGQARDALTERGEKLQSLEEKTSQLVDASQNFADMAKELRKQQENRGLFW